MLVLTRRENEKILLPDVGVTVELMSVSGKTPVWESKALSDIRILREEVAFDRDAIQHVASRGPIPAAKFAHAMPEPSPTVRSLRPKCFDCTLLERGAVAESMGPLEKIVAELKAMTVLLQSEPPAASPPSPPPVSPSKARRLWKARFVVEDNANESNLLAGILRMTGFEVDIAGDGTRTRWIIWHTHDRPDVVLLDMLMPRCDGPTTIGRIRRDPNLEGVKIYAVSGTSPNWIGPHHGTRRSGPLVLQTP